MSAFLLLLPALFFTSLPTPSGLDLERDAGALTARFLAGDLVTLERALLLARTEGPPLGRLGYLADLSLLVRCLPLGPIPAGESPHFSVARRVVRLERLRIERRLRDRTYQGGAYEPLLAAGVPIFNTKPADQSAVIVRWPSEQERWIDELPEAVIEPSRCKEGPHPALQEAQPGQLALLRDAEERRMLTEMIPDLSELLPEIAGRLAHTYLDLAVAAKGLVLPAEWQDPLFALIEQAEPPLRSAARMNLALLALRSQDPARAEAHFRALLADPSRSAAEESRALLRLVELLEPRWQEILNLTEDPNAREEDRPFLLLSRARALYSLHDFDGLRRFGRKFIPERGRAPPSAKAAVDGIEEILLSLSLELASSEAMAWAEEIGDHARREDRLDRLGRLASESNRTDLAIAVYDRLRLEAKESRTKRGPSAASELARFTAERALIEYQLDDPAAFLGLVDELIQLSRAEETKPLARFAPHREVARLCQILVPKLIEAGRDKPDTTRFAGALLEAIAAVKKGERSRFASLLEGHTEALTKLAGPYAAGRTLPAIEKSRTPKGRPVRNLGEVRLPRLPARIEAPDHPSERREVDSYLSYPDQNGRWRVGVPWKR